MALVARNEVIDCTNPKLDIFLKKAGVFIDVAVLEFIIFDVSTPAKQITPLQVFPVAGRQALDPTQDCPAGERLSTGHFTAVWTVAVDEELGSHEIRWFFKEVMASPEETFSEEFEVSSVAASTADLYITVQDVRDVGVDVAIATDGEVESAIRINQAFIDRSTRQWFNSRNLTVKLNGDNSDTLNVPIPIITVSTLKINNQDNALDATSYLVYNGRDFPDDRLNPRISLMRGDQDLFTDPFRADRGLIFRKGRQNQEIVGTFGYTEPDGSTPELIKRALLKLVVEKLTNPVYIATGTAAPVPPPPGPTGDILRETTDGHTIQYTFVKFGDMRSGLSGYTMDREVLTILALYRAPIGVAAASARWLS